MSARLNGTAARRARQKREAARQANKAHTKAQKRVRQRANTASSRARRLAARAQGTWKREPTLAELSARLEALKTS